VIGAFVITGLENVLADRVGSWVTVVIGVIFVVSVLLFRQGLVGTLKRYWPGGARRRQEAL
jgi:branched-chain amino acid transport system permease protein